MERLANIANVSPNDVMVKPDSLRASTGQPMLQAVRAEQLGEFGVTVRLRM
jgi:hypothetical protein